MKQAARGHSTAPPLFRQNQRVVTDADANAGLTVAP